MSPLLLFLLGCAVVYVGTVQAAFSALMRLSLRLMAERNGRSVHLGRYLDDPLLLFVPARLLLGLAFVLATVLVIGLVGTGSPHLTAAAIVLTFGVVLVCEHVIPLLIVRRDPERVLDILLPSFEIAARIMQPLTMAFVRIAGTLGRAPTIEAGTGEGVDEQGEASHGVETGEGEALMERDERRLLQSIVDFGDRLVREVMTPRPDVVAIPADATLTELRALIREQEYSRIPVYRESLDDIAGVVFVKDLIKFDRPAGQEPLVEGLARPAYFVPETKRVPELLKEFQRQQTQIAIVVDEYGGTAGLVTIEDLLEEIVGEIRDEYDQETEPITEEPDGAFVFSGKVNIDEVAERLETQIEPEGFETVGGYLLSHLGRVPGVGESFDIDGLTVEVLEAERRRVNKVRIRRRQTVSEGS